MKRSKFATALATKLEEKNWRPIQLETEGRKKGMKITRQYVGKILNDTPHGVTGAPPKPSVQFIENVAALLDWDLDDALVKGGYAPRTISETEITDELMNAVFSKYKKAQPQKREELRVILEMVDRKLAEED